MTDIQYFVNWRMNANQLIGMIPNIRIDWEADEGDRLSFPVGLGTIGLFKIGKVPIRWGIEGQYDAIQGNDDVTPEWNLKVFFSPVILNPFK